MFNSGLSVFIKELLLLLLLCVSYVQSATISLSTLIGWRLSVLINDMLCYVMLCYMSRH